MAENVNSLGNRAIESGLRLYNRLTNRKDLPANRRIFLESVLDKSKDPITERSFSPDELKTLEEIISSKYSVTLPAIDEYESYLKSKLAAHNKAKADKNKGSIMYPEAAARYETDLKAIQQFRKGKLTSDFLDLTAGNTDYYRSLAFGKLKNADLFNISPSIQYDDYAVGNPDNISVSADENKKVALMRTLGRFGYEIDPKTNNLVIVDKYDFNPPVNIFTQQTSKKTPPVNEGAVATLGAEPGDGGMYGLLRRYAGNKLPPGSGRDVRIQLNSLPPLQPQNMLTK